MSDLFFSTMERLRPALLRGDLKACESEVAGELQKLASTPFHLVLDLSITNDPANAARHFDRFFDVESKRFQIGAAYTEMNGFDINPGRWYCDLFAYTADGGHEEYDWISDWQSNRFDDYEINGLERLQEVYASQAFRAKENRAASYMSSLMVVVKFQRFMERAASHMKALQFPLYVTAHDFDFIAAFDPRPESSRTPVRKLSAEELTSELITKLHDEDPQTRFRAVAKLYGLGPAAKQAVAALIERLEDPHAATREFAATALAKIDPVSDLVVSALVARLTQDQPSHVRQEIVRALGSSPTKKATEALANALFDDDRLVRRYSVISLKVLGREAKDAAPALQKLLETETDNEIRSQATVALERMRE
jgi:hypothetical protein